MGRKFLVGLAIVVAVTAAATTPVLAHGVGRRGDLPLPLWQFVYGAVFAIGISVFAAGKLWTSPRIARLGVGRAAPSWANRTAGAFTVLLRAVGLAVFGVTLVAGLFVTRDLDVNITPWTVFIALWIGVQFVSVIFGDVYRYVNPLYTIATAIEWLRDRLSPGWETVEYRRTQWAAVASMVGFLWLELAYFDPASPRLLGRLMVAYAVVYLVAAWRYGRDCLLISEAFAAFFTILSALAPVARGSDGRLRFRVPGSGLSDVEVLPGTAALILVTLGGTSFDGLTRTEFWSDVVGFRTGWTFTLYNTLGMIWMMAVVVVLYVFAVRLVARIVDGSAVEAGDWFVPSLVPIALGYAIAHYFSVFVLDGGQDFLIRLSDPFDQGWDVFGTADWTVNFTLVSAVTIAWVQAGGIVIGHVAGVFAAHDRALEVYDTKAATRSQYPMVAIMVIYTVGALVLLLGA